MEAQSGEEFVPQRKGGCRKHFLWPLLVAFVVYAATCFIRVIVVPSENYSTNDHALPKGGRDGSFVALQHEGGTNYDEGACTSPSNFVMQGVDLVAFFSLQQGNPAVKGSPEYASIYNGYRFMFSSSENKALFEASPLRWIPRFGGFCAWGIAQETYWNKYDLGPPSTPEVWMVTSDGILLFFRSPTPKAWFSGNLDENIRSGDANWNFWFGDETPGTSYLDSPLNTGCFCSGLSC